MRAFVFCAALALAGCRKGSAPTASGSPEITVSGVRADQVKGAIVHRMMNSGLRIKNNSAYSLVFEGRWPNEIANVLLMTGYGDPVERVSFAIAETSGGTRVVADRKLVSNAGSGFERSTSANNAPGTKDLQLVLDEIGGGVLGCIVAERLGATPQLATTWLQAIRSVMMD